MNDHRVLLLALLVLLCRAGFSHGVEIDGTVVAVDGTTIRIETTAAQLPARGDKLIVWVEIPGVGTAEVGTGMVTGLDGDVILAEIRAATGRVAAGQRATVDSDRPVPRPARTVTDFEQLQGEWLCTETLLSGKPSDHYVGVRARFDGEKMTWLYPLGDGQYRERECRFRIDPLQQPKHFDWHLANEPDKVFLRLYELEEDTLRWATDISIKQRPESFAVARYQFTCVRVARDGATEPMEFAHGDVKATEIAAWGTVTDPDGDCSIAANGTKLTIAVPGRIHDLHYVGDDPARRWNNAPRVLQEIEGDFIAQVRITADWTLGATPANGRNFSTAGLLVWESELQYLRHERNVYVPPAYAESVYYFFPPVYDRNRTRISPWRVGRVGDPSDPFRGRTTWLKVERTGQNFATAISHDGTQWTETDVLTTEFPNRVSVGVVALNCSERDFIVEFDDFLLIRSGP